MVENVEQTPETDDQDDSEFDLKLSGDGITVERKVGRDTARDILNIIMGGEVSAPRVRGQARAAPPSDTGGRPKFSVREYFNECQPKRNPDKITAIGAYIEDHEGGEGFTRNDVKAKFRAAGEKAPGNFGRDFAWTISSGWIAEDTHAPGEYYVTEIGRKAIADQFSSEVAKSAPQPRRKRKPRKGQANKGNSGA